MQTNSSRGMVDDWMSEMKESENAEMGFLG